MDKLRVDELMTKIKPKNSWKVLLHVKIFSQLDMLYDCNFGRCNQLFFYFHTRKFSFQHIAGCLIQNRPTAEIVQKVTSVSWMKVNHRTWHVVWRGVGRGQPIGSADWRVTAGGPSPGLASDRLTTHPHSQNTGTSRHSASAFNRARDTTNKSTTRR